MRGMSTTASSSGRWRSQARRRVNRARRGAARLPASHSTLPGCRWRSGFECEPRAGSFTPSEVALTPAFAVRCCRPSTPSIAWRSGSTLPGAPKARTTLVTSRIPKRRAGVIARSRRCCGHRPILLARIGIVNLRDHGLARHRTMLVDGTLDFGVLLGEHHIGNSSASAPADRAIKGLPRLRRPSGRRARRSRGLRGGRHRQSQGQCGGGLREAAEELQPRNRRDFVAVAGRG